MKKNTFKERSRMIIVDSANYSIMTKVLSDLGVCFDSKHTKDWSLHLVRFEMDLAKLTIIESILKNKKCKYQILT